MHAALSQGGMAADQGVAFWRDLSERRPEPVVVAPALHTPIERPGGFAAERPPNWTAIATIALLHLLLLYALVKFDEIAVARPKPKPLVVDLLKLAPPPPPSTPLPEQKVAPPEPVTPRIVTPPPVVVTPAPAPPVSVTRDPPPVKTAIVAPAAPPAVPTGPVSVEDLSSTMISAPPPRYPVESRRRKEQGTVFLSVLVGTDGRVSEIGISRSSGSERLDKAALEAVRRWRWSPTMRNGLAVMVRGIVDIPFVLQG